MTRAISYIISSKYNSEFKFCFPIEINKIFHLYLYDIENGDKAQKNFIKDLLNEVALVISAENNLKQNFIVNVKTLWNIFADDIENDDKDQKNFILKKKLFEMDFYHIFFHL